MRRTTTAAEDQALQIPTITTIANDVIDWTKATFSNRQYDLHNKTLRVVWTPDKTFKAEARIDADGAHVISLSYGAAIETYRDAWILPHYCERRFQQGNEGEVMAAAAYDQRESILPEGVTPMDAKVEIVMASLKWLYLHEQAHLFQGHGAVATALGAGQLLGLHSSISESPDAPQPTLSAEASAIRHLFELSADYEATQMLIGSMAAKPGGLKVKELWLLIVGLMCMFMLFDRGSATAALPQGTHPPATIRIRAVIRQILWLLQEATSAPHIGPLRDQEFAAKVAEHAVVTATLYWHVRYLENIGTLPPFLENSTRRDAVPAQYRSTLQDVWSRVRPEILTRYMGWTRDCILDIAILDDPPDLSATR